jgi:DNA-binding IclR family transcriptional regulator
MAGNAVESGRTVTSKVTAILMAFTGGTGWSLTELARLTNIPLTTTHRLVTELTAAQLLERAPDGGYRVGPAMGRLCGGAQGAPTVAQLAPVVLDDLAGATGRPVRLGMLHDLRVAYVEKAGRAPATSFGAGAVLPVHASALGKILLAFAPASTVRAVVSGGLRRYTPRTVTRPDRLLHALSVARLTRIATCEGELVAGEYTVAAPVVGPGGRVVAALETRVPDLGAGLDTTRHVLTLAARSLSRELSGAGSPVPDVAIPMVVGPVAVGAAS